MKPDGKIKVKLAEKTSCTYRTSPNVSFELQISVPIPPTSINTTSQLLAT